ncbi:hypothetical protein BRYFOR_07859 [Marvinbryantia formatexigens DSM 14469]|uniref:Uncharacterized protein n=1 Tax=Marvinbryantia formatexigens DSM 14469 TaxID=478749 RepID=C6LGU9_9FIRM|nr:hypothetical protein BRYFOR_07859 [Marvinbryantia formatexigens DSM 14469]
MPAQKVPEGCQHTKMRQPLSFLMGAVLICVRNRQKLASIRLIFFFPHR